MAQTVVVNFSNHALEEKNGTKIPGLVNAQDNQFGMESSVF